MEDTRAEIKENIKINSKINHFVNRFLLNPFLAAISGFTLFFLFAILIDFIVNIPNPDKVLSIDIFTVLIGVAGFLLAFGFSILENSQNSNK